MKVRATRDGFYKTRIRPGSVFEVEDKYFSSKWMEKVVDPSPSLSVEVSEKEDEAQPKKRGRPKKSEEICHQ